VFWVQELYVEPHLLISFAKFCTPAALPAVLVNGYDHYKYARSLDDQINMHGRGALLNRYRKAVEAALFAYAMVVLVSLLLLPRNVLMVFVPTALVIPAYWLPILPNGKTAKHIPGVKNVFVASLETVFFVAVALASVPNATCELAQSAAVAMFCVLVNTALEVLEDVRDLKGDRADGVCSIPVQFGVPAALATASACASAAVVSVLMALPHAWPMCSAALLVLLRVVPFAAEALEQPLSLWRRSHSSAGSSSVDLRVWDSWFHALVGVVGLVAVRF
jgi:4-hydroxybenzoate polyprenyltransferase